MNLTAHYFIICVVHTGQRYKFVFINDNACLWRGVGRFQTPGLKRVTALSPALNTTQWDKLKSLHFRSVSFEAICASMFPVNTEHRAEIKSKAAVFTQDNVSNMIFLINLFYLISLSYKSQWKVLSSYEEPLRKTITVNIFCHLVGCVEGSDGDHLTSELSLRVVEKLEN